MLGPQLCNAVVLSPAGRLRLKVGVGSNSVLWKNQGQASGTSHCTRPPTPIPPELALASPSPRPGRSSSSTASCLVHLEALAPRFLRLLPELLVVAGDGHEVPAPCSRKLSSGRGNGACLVNRA